jgi:hypothetical protein
MQIGDTFGYWAPAVPPSLRGFLHQLPRAMLVCWATMYDVANHMPPSCAAVGDFPVPRQEFHTLHLCGMTRADNFGQVNLQGGR